MKSIPLLDAPALEAVGQWKYRPATQDGRPVRVLMTIVVSFKLRDGPPLSPGPPRWGTATPLEVSGKVQPPRLVTKVDPQYPEEAQRDQVEGNVGLQVIIDTEGNVESASVLRSVPLLDDAAIAAVKQWKYEPATLDGRPVRVRYTVIVNFSLGAGT